MAAFFLDIHLALKLNLYLPFLQLLQNHRQVIIVFQAWFFFFVAHQNNSFDG
jgi:hypothetical protein